MKRFWLKKGLMFIALFIVALIVFGEIVMALWNAILPDVLGVKAITFQQAIGILVLSKILFGGFGHRGGWRKGRPDNWRNNMRDKFGNMSAEEREKFRTEWKNRCSGRGWRTDKRNGNGGE